jgi:hypothetical protein
MTEKTEAARYRLRASVIVPPEIPAGAREGALAPGDTVELPVAYGDHLVAERLAERVQDDDPGPGLSDDELREALIDILMEIGAEEGGDGVPNMDVVRAGLVKAGAITAAEAKKRVTTEMRDAAWAELQE